MNKKDLDGVTREKIYKYILKEKEVKPDSIIWDLNLSKSMVHRHLKKLLEEKRIFKEGVPPKVFYSAHKTKTKKNLKDEVEFIAKITRPIFKKYGLKKVELFGSAARGEMTDKSDVDFLVEIGKPLGYAFVSLSYDLEDVLKRKVDLVTKNSLSKFIAPHIKKDLIKIYER